MTDSDGPTPERPLTPLGTVIRERARALNPLVAAERWRNQRERTELSLREMQALIEERGGGHLSIKAIQNAMYVIPKPRPATVQALARGLAGVTDEPAATFEPYEQLHRRMLDATKRPWPRQAKPLDVNDLADLTSGDRVLVEELVSRLASARRALRSAGVGDDETADQDTDLGEGESGGDDPDSAPGPVLGQN